jgi:hypothetical protein
MAKVYALYDSNNELVDVFSNKLTAVESMTGLISSEVRTYAYLTATQVKSLCYAEAIGMELTFRSNNNEPLTETTRK